jgi:protease-4
MKNKLHIHIDTVKTNPHADMGIFRPMDDAEKSYMQKNVEHVYRMFIKRVADGRNMSPEQVDSIGQGRVWSGKRAVEIGLADFEGTLQDAIELAAQKADLKVYKVQFYPQIENPFSALFSLQNSDMENRIKARIFKDLTGFDYPGDFNYLLDKRNRIQARLPYHIKFND